MSQPSLRLRCLQDCANLAVQKWKALGVSKAKFAALLGISASTFQSLLNNAELGDPAKAPHKRGPHSGTFSSIVSSRLWSDEEREIVWRAVAFDEYLEVLAQAKAAPTTERTRRFRADNA